MFKLRAGKKNHPTVYGFASLPRCILRPSRVRSAAEETICVQTGRTGTTSGGSVPASSCVLTSSLWLCACEQTLTSRVPGHSSAAPAPSRGTLRSLQLHPISTAVSDGVLIYKGSRLRTCQRRIDALSGSSWLLCVGGYACFCFFFFLVSNSASQRLLVFGPVLEFGEVPPHPATPFRLPLYSFLVCVGDPAWV